ncbi:ribonuclease P protein component [Micromonospora sp. CPCC 206060]|uniref:ribonuclease P protein component n=1 Tax=Micromonospora sp. CPCC 206060 TaxID=3122406 RepID=UPI002FF1AABB
MLAAAQRLRRSVDFAAAVRGGRRAGRGAVVVHLHLPDTIGTPDVSSPAEPARTIDAEQPSVSARAGFVVSKAVGNAVVRNAVRRRLRHLVRERLDSLPAGATLVVRALPAAAGASYTRLGADLDAALAAARTPRGSGRRPR